MVVDIKLIQEKIIEIRDGFRAIQLLEGINEHGSRIFWEVMSILHNWRIDRLEFLSEILRDEPLVRIVFFWGNFGEISATVPPTQILYHPDDRRIHRRILSKNFSLQRERTMDGITYTVVGIIVGKNEQDGEIYLSVKDQGQQISLFIPFADICSILPLE